MAANANLHKAKSEKNDEFYTQLTDVAAELKHYKQHFSGKIVLCNCDDPTWSAFWKYFHLNFAKLGLKKLISTHYDRTEPTYKMEYEGGDDDNVEVGVKTPLEGNGDFRNQECLDLLDECDIVVTNPPFSLFREYVHVLMEYGKKFVIIGNMNCVTYKEIFPLIKDGKVWPGYAFNKTFEFIMPDDYELKGKAYIDVNGKKHGFVPGICWFTNLNIGKRHEKLPLWKHYTPEEFPKYDNYDAINVDKVSEIPCDYDGVMGVPITFLDKYNPEQFEIVAFRKGDDGKDLVFTREREREFNRTFEFLFDGVSVESWADEQSQGYVSERKEQVCQSSDTTVDMRFFAEYICAHPELVRLALAERERERERERRSRRSSGMRQICRTASSTTVPSMDAKRMCGCSSGGVECVLPEQPSYTRCDEPSGRDAGTRSTCLQKDLCTTDTEPVSIFFPLSITNRAAGTMNGLLNGKETYRRILIRRK